MVRSSSIAQVSSSFGRRSLRARRPRIVALVALLGALCCAMSVLKASDGRAQGLLETLFGDAPRYGASPYENSGYYRPQRRGRFYHGGRRHAPGRRNEATHSRRSGDAFNDGKSYGFAWSWSGPRAMCRRTCDGYSFPLGDYKGRSEIARQEAACHSLCPNAETKLYVMPHGSENVTSVRDLDTARVRRDQNGDKTCSCFGPASDADRVRALFTDRTLRKGDTVMTLQGIRIFRGARHYPFTINDFVSLNRSRGMRTQTRRMLAAIERARIRNGAPASFADRALAHARHERSGARPGPEPAAPNAPSR
jgi:hypothetical protein